MAEWLLAAMITFDAIVVVPWMIRLNEENKMLKRNQR